MDALTIKQHDTRPPLQLVCTDNGAPVDLTTAESIRIIGVLEGMTVFDDAITGNASGVVTRQWEAEDTDTSGTLLVEVEVTGADGGIQTFPPGGYLTVEILPDLG